MPGSPTLIDAPIDTPYRYDVACRECDTEFTERVQITTWTPTDPAQVDRPGDYIREWDYSVPTLCQECREGRIQVHTTLDLNNDEVYLPLWERLIATILGRTRDDLVPDPIPPQDEQVDAIAARFQTFSDPYSRGIDWFIFKDEDARPIWHAKQRLDDEHFRELERRINDAVGGGVDLDDLAERGRQSIIDDYGPEKVGGGEDSNSTADEGNGGET